MLKHHDGFVMKPVQNDKRGNNETNFYDEVSQSTDPLLLRLKNHIPAFLGLHQFVTEHASMQFLNFQVK